MDSGANVFVGSRSKYFSQITRRCIGVALGAGMNHFFEGIGVMMISFPSYPSKLILLYPSSYAPRDNICTISNGAPFKCSGFDRVIIDTARSVHLIHRDDSRMSIPTTHRSSTDYISANIHRPSRETCQRLNHRHICHCNLLASTISSFVAVPYSPGCYISSINIDLSRLSKQ